MANGQFGPIYPDLGAKVAKLRHGDDRKAHGRAVLDAIRAKQRSECLRVLPAAKRPHCASKSDATTGAAILNAVNQQNRTRAQAAPTVWYDERKQRQIYNELMIAKRAVPVTS